MTFKTTLAPAAIVLGVVTPETLNGPAPADTEEIVRLEPPTLLTVTVPFVDVPTTALPRLRLVGVTEICCAVVVAVPASATGPDVTPVSVCTVNVPEMFPADVALNQI